MLISAAGQVMRVAADSIPVQGRRTQGRKIAKLGAGDRVAEVTRAQGGEAGPAPAPALTGSGGGQLDLLG